MILSFIQMFFPRYYARVWNEEFLQQMEDLRAGLHAEFPNAPDIVNQRVDEAIERWKK